MARPKQFEDDALLESMREAFLEIGPGISTQELARRAKVSEGTLFKRFGSKRKMFTVSLRLPDVQDYEWFVSMDRAREGETLETRLLRLGLGLHDFISEMLPCVQMIAANSKLQPQDFRDLIGEDTDEAPPFIVIGKFRALFDREMDAGRIRRTNAEDLARMFIGGIINDAHVRQHFPVELMRSRIDVLSSLTHTLCQLIQRS